jgi:hypothetical protein
MIKMNLNEIKEAVDNGETVYWSNKNYKVVKDKNNNYLIKHENGNSIDLTWEDNITLNGEEYEFFISKKLTSRLYSTDKNRTFDLNKIITIKDQTGEELEQIVVYDRKLVEKKKYYWCVEGVDYDENLVVEHLNFFQNYMKIDIIVNKGEN